MLRGAAATRCLAEVHVRARSLQEASRTAFLAATYLDTVHVQERGVVLCLRGAALLSAAAASARRGDRREARTALKAADGCAVGLNEDRSDLGTVFGPTNVAIHQVAVAVELGDPFEAVSHIPKWTLIECRDNLPNVALVSLLMLRVAIRNSGTIQRPWMRCCRPRLLRPMNSVTTGSRMRYCEASSRTSDARPDFAHSRIGAGCCEREC